MGVGVGVGVGVRVGVRVAVRVGVGVGGGCSTRQCVPSEQASTVLSTVHVVPGTQRPAPSLVCVQVGGGPDRIGVGTLGSMCMHAAG